MRRCARARAHTHAHPHTPHHCVRCMIRVRSHRDSIYDARVHTRTHTHTHARTHTHTTGRGIRALPPRALGACAVRRWLLLCSVAALATTAIQECCPGPRARSEGTHARARARTHRPTHTGLDSSPNFTAAVLTQSPVAARLADGSRKLVGHGAARSRSQKRPDDVE